MHDLYRIRKGEKELKEEDVVVVLRLDDKTVNVTWADGEEELLPLVQPDLGEPGVVVVDNLGRAAGERVRGRLAEHVAHVRAGGDQELAAASPNLLRS